MKINKSILLILAKSKYIDENVLNIDNPIIFGRSIVFDIKSSEHNREQGIISISDYNKEYTKIKQEKREKKLKRILYGDKSKG